MLKKELERVLFAGGGTGGHVYMAVSIAQHLGSIQPSTRFLFVGTPQGMETRILPPLGYELQTISIGGLKRVGFLRATGTLARLPWSLGQAIRIVRFFSPNVAVGVGGYASGPVILAARLLDVPSLLIEPNVFPGLTNRILARWVARAAVAYEETARWFGAKARLTGIPVRQEFHRLAGSIPETGPLRLLAFGGSRGSHAINRLLCDALPHLTGGRFEIVHQTGYQDFDWVDEVYRQHSVPAEVVRYISDMPAHFDRSDLVLCRAGASTLAEIAAAGKAAILIPFPEATDDHQTKNAVALASRGAALAIDQRTTSGKALAELLGRLESDRAELRLVAERVRELGQPGSAERIVDLLMEIAA